MEEREFRKQEFKIEFKCVCILSVDHINEIKDRFIKLVEKRIEHYNLEYYFEKDGKAEFENKNVQGIFIGKIMEYKGINQEEKDFMNGVVREIRESGFKNNGPIRDFNESQKIAIDSIYGKMKSELEKTMENL